MKTVNKQSVMKTVTAAAASVGLISTPVSAATHTANEHSKTELRSNANQNVASQGYAAGLELINTNTKADLAAAKKTGLVEASDGTVSYYDTFGQKATGAVSTEAGDYYFDENGDMETGFITENGKTYYYDNNTGLKQSGTIDVDGSTYILSDTGATQQGWVETDEGKVYLDENGAVVKDTTRSIDGQQYSFDANGHMETNVTKNGWTYDENGVGTEDLSGYDKIAQAALAQLGVAQDCTRLVSNALAAVGINHHGWPESYLSLGPLTSNPVPGDICVYQGHVAIYIGNGQAVHGGWNGGTTAIFSVQCSTPFIGYVHPILP